MSDSAYYRSEAQRMLDWADTSFDSNLALRWRTLAHDYLALAEQLDAKEANRTPLQAIPMQQQQAKTREGK